MEIKERTTKTGKNAGKTYFFVEDVEMGGKIVASYEKSDIEAYKLDSGSVELREFNGWYWVHNRGGLNTPKSNVNGGRSLLSRLVDTLTLEEKEELRRLL